MANNETTRSAARNALEAYKASPGMVDDDETAIIDLIADLAFLADSLDINGEYVIERGAWHYVEDRREQDDDDDDDDVDVIDVEEVPELEPGPGALPHG